MNDFHAYYQFEFSFIPSLMERYRNEGFKLPILNDKNSWQGLLTRLFVDSGFSWHELKINTYGNEEDDTIVVLYIFPEPFRSPLAKYGAIVVKENRISYYTLELSTDGKYMFCSQTTYGMHINYGESPELSQEEFLEKVCAISEITLPAPQSHRSKESWRERLKKLF